LAHVINLAAQQALLTLKADEASDEKTGSLIRKVINLIIIVIIIII